METNDYNTINGDPENTRDKIDNSDLATEPNSDNTGRSIISGHLSDEPPINDKESSPQKLIIKVFGNDLRESSPIKMGNMYTLIFIQDNPMIAIGPQCI